VGSMLSFFFLTAPSLLLRPSGAPTVGGRQQPQPRMQLAPVANKLLVIGGNGFVGREVCKNAVKAGYKVTSLSRRGECPKPGDELLSQVEWRAGNALDKAVVSKMVGEADAVVHCIGLLFDVDSGLKILNTFTSASGSKPDDSSTYDRITRETMFNVVDAINGKLTLLPPPLGTPMPMAFISCAEAGWPDVQFGEQVEEASPDWLKRYLAAKRSVEAKLASTNKLRPIIYRPSLIWDWKKFDVLPVIPVFNIASALGVPFIDKTVRVEDLGKAIVAGLVDAEVSGVQRFAQIESLAEAL